MFAQIREAAGKFSTAELALMQQLLRGRAHWGRTLLSYITCSLLKKSYEARAIAHYVQSSLALMLGLFQRKSNIWMRLVLLLNAYIHLVLGKLEDRYATDSEFEEQERDRAVLNQLRMTALSELVWECAVAADSARSNALTDFMSVGQVAQVFTYYNLVMVPQPLHERFLLPHEHPAALNHQDRAPLQVLAPGPA